MARQRIVRFVQRADQDVGAARERVDVGSRGERLHAIDARGRETVALRPGAGRSADPRLLNADVDRRESGEQSQLLLALADLAERILQADHALAHALNLVGEETVLPLERATARDADPA